MATYTATFQGVEKSRPGEHLRFDGKVLSLPVLTSAADSVNYQNWKDNARKTLDGKAYSTADITISVTNNVPTITVSQSA